MYLRFSSENQREELIEGQRRESTAFAKSRGIEIVREYVDRAKSATTDNRPQFQQMINDARFGGFDTVIVWKLDRFARNRKDSADYKAILRERGVDVLSATERISRGADGILLESVLEGQAEYYSADLSEKVRRGLTENVLKGKAIGGSRPFGCRIENGVYVIDGQEPPLVKEMYRLYVDEGMCQIAERLTEKGYARSDGKRIKHNIVEKVVIFFGFNKSYLKPEALKNLSADSISSEYDSYPPITHSLNSSNDLLPFVPTAKYLNDLPEPQDSKDIDQQHYSKTRFQSNRSQGQTEVDLSSVGPTIRSDHHGNIVFRRLSSAHGGKHYDELKKGLIER